MEVRLRAQKAVSLRMADRPVKKLAAIVTLSSLLALAPLLSAQTFQIEGQSGGSGSAPANGATKKNQSAAAEGGIGWGNSVEVGRLSRAAEQALAHGNPSQAADYAARAVQAAPQNSRLWFLLGYTARLAGRYQQSIDAYQHGLKQEPSAIEGLSGLAQTYMHTGNADEAKQLLLQVIAANPRRPTDLAMAGELFLQSGDNQRAVDLLQRSEAMQPGVHTEVLLASAYMKLKQPQKAQEVLDRARARGGNSAEVFRAVANYYRTERNFPAAIQTLQQIPQKTPEILAELGYTYMLAGNKSEAAEAYAQAAAAAPRDIKIQLSAAESQMRIGHDDTARKYLAQAESLDARNYRLHALRADLARTQVRNEDAIKEYQLALANLPPAGVPEGVLYPIQLRLALADQYRENGDDANARQQVDLAAKQIAQLDMQGPSRAEFLRLRASIKAASDDFSGAENDLKEAMSVDPDNLNVVIQYAAMLWRMKRPADARKLYQSALAKDPNNRFALESLGYLAREEGDNKTAEEFFHKLGDAYPNDFVAYVALGDLYTAERRFPEAQQNYEKAYSYTSSNAQIIAGGANAAIEAHEIDLAETWLARAHGSMKDDPRVMREEERFLFHKGKFLESAQLGRKVLEKLPNDREGSVYLAYDLYNLGRFDDALALSRKYQQILPKEPNFPLLAGHAEKQSQLLAEAVDDYTHVIEIDPTIDQAWINRGYVLNDLQNADQASRDFQYVLKTEPDNGVAHLGLAFSYLQLHQGKLALAEADKAQSLLGESGSTHLARASAFRQMRLLNDAEKEYRAALQYTPKDLTLQLALADTLYHLRRYTESIAALNDALALLPDDAAIYGKLAHAYARLHDRDMTLRYVSAAEQQEPDASSILLDTGDALLTLGDEAAAMDRFKRALEAPDANRVDARLLIAKVMVSRSHWAAARQQISLAFAEARIGEASPVTTDNLVEAANLFLRMHDFELAQKYFLTAKQAGAGDQVVAIGLANTYLAQGDTAQAEAQLRGLGDAANFANDYDYTLAMANLYRERGDTPQALSLFARANTLGGDEDITGRAVEDLAEQEGYALNQKLSVFSDLKMGGVFDDSTIYTSYSRLNQINAAITPHSLLETRWIDGFHLHEGDLPLISGFFEERNARGSFSVPSQFKFVPEDTYDSIFNGGLNPVLHLGHDYLAFNTSLAFTLRRDRESPVALDQNLFRQQIYMHSSPFWNWISVQGSAMHEAGPFTEQNLHSRDLVADVQFRVGRPWGKTAFLTGYRVRDLLFHPQQQEWFQTASWVGLERKFGTKLTVGAKGEYVRAWAVLNNNFGTAQMVRPAFEFDYQPKRHWEANGSFAFSSGRGDHVYDNMQSGFFISYVKPLRRGLHVGAGEVPVDYPLRFSIGLQQQDFINYAGAGQAQQFQPVFRLTIF